MKFYVYLPAEVYAENGDRVCNGTCIVEVDAKGWPARRPEARRIASDPPARQASACDPAEGRAHPERCPMKEYTVSGHVTVSVSTTVYAKSKVEAKRLAAERSIKDLCHQCSRDSDDEWVIDTDGEVAITEVVAGDGT